MADIDDLLLRPATELARLVRDGEVKPRELAEASVRRIEALDPALNAFVDVDGDKAVAQADAIAPGDERPFAGVPTAIKNNRGVEGWRLTYSCKLMDEFVSPVDHNVSARLKGAGMVVVGTTNLPEYGILPVSEPTTHGAARNPWDPSRTPGGSSGGSAAAVAAGMVPVAHANDGGGSTRIPAACCGLVGLKPSRGRISLAPELGDHPLVQDGMLTRTVADTAALLDVLAGPEPGDATWATPPSEPYAVAAQHDPGRLRIGVAVTPPLPDAEVSDDAVDAARRAGELLASLGHDVEDFEPGWVNESLLPLFSAEFGTAIAMSVAYSGMIAGRDPQADDMQALSWALYTAAREGSALDVAGARVMLQGAMRALVAELSAYDVVLTPALAQPPLPIGTLDPDGESPMLAFAESGRFTPFTAGMNASGQPAISVPLFQSDAGLPLGVQLIGQPEREDVLLQVATQLEGAQPWADRVPDLAALTE